MNPGDLAPDFSLPDQDGEQRTLSDLVAHGPVVLFFYPAAMTKGCTKESCHFRDLGPEFATLGAQRIGISMDGVDRQSKFASENRLDYPLLSDAGGLVAQQFGVKRIFDFLKVQRATFVIGQDRRVHAIINNELHMNVHANRALDALRAAAT